MSAVSDYPESESGHDQYQCTGGSGPSRTSSAETVSLEPSANEISSLTDRSFDASKVVQSLLARQAPSRRGFLGASRSSVPHSRTDGRRAVAADTERRPSDETPPGRTPDAPLVSLPSLQGLRFVGGFAIKPEFFALVVAIAVFGGAYVAEIVRGGLLSVDRGRIEAARALGLSGFQVNRFVRLPLAVRAILPALSNQYIWLMKATTLGIAIGFPDYFMVVSTSINQSGQTIELLALLMGGFLLINYVMGASLNAINARIALKGRT